MGTPREIIVNTDTVGISFDKFYSQIDRIASNIKLTNDIENKDIAIRLHNDEIPLITLNVGTDGKLYIVITKSAYLQCEPSGPLTFVINSYEKLIEFRERMKNIVRTTFNTTTDPIGDAECVVNTEGVITCITYFDLMVKNIGRGRDFNPIVYIRSEI